jgi:HEAT repeat protein
MKKTVAILAAVVLVLMSASIAMAADNTKGLSPAQYARAEENLLIGLNSDNMGVVEGSADMLGELESSKAVVPLMGLLRDGNPESTRIVAALALCRIGDKRGLYAVKRAAQFDGNERVGQRFAFFYNSYAKAGTFEFATVASDGEATVATK